MDEVNETKAKVESKTSKAAESARNTADQVFDQTDKAVNSARSTTKQVINETEKAVDSAVKTVGQVINDASTNVPISNESRGNSLNPVTWVKEGATGVKEGATGLKEGAMSFVEKLRSTDLGLNDEFWVHFNAMQREGLLAARAAVDSFLVKAEKMESERQARRGAISVE